MKNVKLFPEHANITQLKRVKFGIDPTGPRLHLGHLVSLRVVKELMNQGKEVTIVLGTLTGRLGDPTGRDRTRPILSDFEAHSNAEAILKQVKVVLGENFRTWWNHNTGAVEMGAFVLDVVSKFTLAEIEAREGFRQRESVGLHELLVPLLQGFDSVVNDTEIEVGGEDQLFNFSLTRTLQKRLNKRQQACVLVPVIRGTDGQKMSKSLNNCIFLDEPLESMREQFLNTRDEVVEEWIPLLSDAKDLADKTLAPQDRKELLFEDVAVQLKLME